MSMQPEITHGTFVVLDTDEGIVCIPPNINEEDMIFPSTRVFSREQATGYFARLSMPGFLDCTDWQGPYSTEEAALAALTDQYDLDEEENDNEY